MALAVCLLFDPGDEQAMRRLWQRLEDAGVPSLASHTHRRHVPHLSLAVLRTGDVSEIREAVEGLPDAGATALSFDALGIFRRGRCWLAPAVSTDLAHRQEAVATSVAQTGAELHRHYAPEAWIPHCTLAPRVRLESLSALAALVYDVLPLRVHADRAALIDSGTGQTWPLGAVP